MQLEQAKQVQEEIDAILLGERRGEDERRTEDAGIGEIPNDKGDAAISGVGAGTEQVGTVLPAAVESTQAKSKYDLALEEVNGILERKSADARAADDAGMGTTREYADQTGATVGFIPWQVGEAVTAIEPKTKQEISAEVVKAEEIGGRIMVKLTQEGHILRGEQLEWPIKLLKRAARRE